MGDNTPPGRDHQKAERPPHTQHMGEIIRHQGRITKRPKDPYAVAKSTLYGVGWGGIRCEGTRRISNMLM